MSHYNKKKRSSSINDKDYFLNSNTNTDTNKGKKANVEYKKKSHM